MMKSIVLLSGGMDSATLLAQAVSQQGADNVTAVAFDYGQRHARELEAAEALAAHYEVELVLLDLKGAAAAFAGSSQTSPDIKVPEGHYAEESMKATVVPNRNMVMLSLAAALAISRKAEVVGYGAHAGDHTIYPDCRPEFTQAMKLALLTCDWQTVGLWTPWLHVRKSDICTIGKRLGVPFSVTWSCYKGGEKHCGKCGTCVERREAFAEAGIEDPTEYEAD